MRVFDFDNAIVRLPGRSVVRGLRSDPETVPDYDAIGREHSAYVAALEKAGLTVEVLPPLEAYPDSVFVEDPAVVLPEGAILLRPGAPARQGESGEMREPLKRHFGQVLELEDGEFADGGDILVTPDIIFIGISRRTNPTGAEALAKKLSQLGRKARAVATPRSVLHFKTAVSLMSEDTLLATRQMAESGLIAGFKILLVPDGEEPAANAVRINDIVLVGQGFPRTQDLLAKEGFALRALPVTEIGKLDAGLSRMSLRWSRRQ